MLSGDSCGIERIFFKMAVTARLCADGNLERGADLDRQEEVIAGTVSLNSG